MSALRASLLSLGFAAGIAFAFVSVRFLREEIVVDRCLSGLHGSFDYSTMSCDLKENHVFVPYSARHPHDEQAFPLAFLTMVAAFVIRRGIRES